MKKLISMLVASAFVVLSVPVVSVAVSSGASAKSKRCTDWCTNRHGQKFRIRH